MENSNQNSAPPIVAMAVSYTHLLRRQGKPSAHPATVGNAQLHVLRLSMGHPFNPSLHGRG